MKNNYENAKKFLEEKGLPAVGPNFENRIIETMVGYAKTTINHLDCIPYQLCPKCNGLKQVMANKIFGESYLSTAPETCDVCNGEGIIPMCVVEKTVCYKDIQVDVNHIKDIVGR